MKPTAIVITGLICVTVLELFALSQGINGILLTMAIAIIAGAMGVMIPTPKRLQ
jgi:hypothetical protein